MRTWRWYSKVSFGLLCLAFAYWVWPTPYHYPEVGPGLVRVNRFTGAVWKAWGPAPGGWQRVGIVATPKTLANPTEEEVPNVIRAQAFQLVDSAGTVRGTLEFNRDGSPELNLYDGEGNQRLLLGPGLLALFNEEGKPQAGLALGDGGNPGIRLLDRQGKLLWRAP